MIRKSVRLVIASAALLPAWAALAGNLPGSFSQINLQGGGYYTGMVQHWSGRLIGRTDGGGVYLSDNGGFLWQYLSGNMYSYASMCVAGIAVPQTASSSSNVILQVVGADWSSLLTDTNRGIWLTTNGGASWAQTLKNVIFYGDAPERVGGEPVIFHPTNDLEAWAGSHAQGLFKSQDGGNTWAQVASIATSNVYASLYIHPSYPGVIWAGGDGGVWVSTNHGANWSQVAFNMAMVLRITGAPDGTIYFGGQNGSSHILKKVTSTNWTNPASYVFTDLVSAYNSGGLSDTDPLSSVTVLRSGWLVAGEYGNCLLSTNGGTNFTSLPGTLVPGTMQPQWSSRSGAYKPTCLIQDVFASNTWYGGFGYGAVRTDDGGQTWQYIVKGIGEVVTFRVGFHPTDPNRLGIPGDDIGGAVVTDGGLSGNTVSMIKPHSSDGLMFAHRALISSNNGVNRYIFVGAEEYYDNGRVYITTNDGASWSTATMAGLPTNQLSDAVDSLDNPDDFLVVSAANSGAGSGGIYRTTNAGASFSQCNWYPSSSTSLGSGDHFVVFLARDATNVNIRYLYSRGRTPNSPPATNSGGGFFISSDRGVNWTQQPYPPVPNDTKDWQADAMVADHAISSNIWLGVQYGTNGLFHSANGGASWSIVGNFTNVLGVDAINGNVVVYGEMATDTWNKIYYSTNSGANWDEITCTNYRFGNCNSVVLDPFRPGRVFIGSEERSIGIFTPGTPVQQWRLQYFMSSNNSGLSADAADPNSNGVPNLVEYALGADPLAGSSSDPLGQASTNGTNYLPFAMMSTNPFLAGQPVMRLNLPDPPPGDIKLQIISSPDMINWSTNAVRAGTNAWQWLGGGSSLIAPGLDTNGRAIFDIGTPAGSGVAQFQYLQVVTN